jgi:DNA polymerase V
MIQAMVYGTAGGKVTGFASPAQGYEDATIDLNSLLIKNPPATYLYRLESGDMAGLGLPRGAILTVDRSRTPIFNQFALIRHEGHFLCRLMVNRRGCTVFTNGLSEIMPIVDETEIVGTVTACIQVYGYDFSY